MLEVNTVNKGKVIWKKGAMNFVRENSKNWRKLCMCKTNKPFFDKSKSIAGIHRDYVIDY